MATKKSGGSSKNGRDSAGRRLGVKTNNFCSIGDILIRQRGLCYLPGNNVMVSSDYTLHALTGGYVFYKKLHENGHLRTYVCVLNPWELPHINQINSTLSIEISRVYSK